ncbi:hypothetical protein Hypma_009590 [Hypsizygus marmoreus]|uniref:Uncharacterized protein n=1 Tax=Hypsizygus marmoreus TaxID=39966 RepID=A0A369JPI7_HYPMA|nr:hypothetical protein Hypma_009590 [Hypsizygus marmoreus]
MTVSAVGGTNDQQDDLEASEKNVIRINIPPRFYLVPGAAIIVGSAIGLLRGSQTASLRFLAENVHRPPTTVQGWYFYNKTKNYKVLYGGLKGAAKEASKLTVVALGWVSIEEGLQRVGWGQFSEVGAALGTAGMFSAVYRLPWKSTRRTLVLGLVMGSGLKMLSWGREQLQTQASILSDNSAAESGNERISGDKKN